MASDPLEIPGTIRLGSGFELDSRLHELRRGDRVLKLERIPMELLLLLVEQTGRTVTREQIVERIWGKGVFLDTDNSINGAIRKIRQVLRDNPERPRFIQTVTGKGYRFIAPVTENVPAPVLSFPEPSPPVGQPQIKKPALLWALYVAVVVILIAAVGAYSLWSHSQIRRLSAGERIIVAILPFQDLTGDAGQDYLSDGLTEEMITQLGRVDPRHLGVIARTSVMHYKDTHLSLRQIGREVGAQYVLEGSIRRVPGKVRITAQLIQVRDQTHVWAREYDRELRDLLGLEGEIAQEVADEIQLTLADHKRDRPSPQPAAAPNSYEAFDLYLKGRYFWNKRTPEGLRQAIACFQQAVDKDPAYARAYAGLADAWVLMSGYSLGPQKEFIPKARAAALKALEIDERLAEAHTSLASIAQNYDWDWQTAEKEFRRAIQLDPNYATAHHWYAEHLALRGRFDEAFSEIERARQLDPLSLIIATDNGAILYFSRQYDRAIQEFRAVLDMEPNFPRAHMLADVYVQKRQFADALADIENWRRISDTPWIFSGLAYIYGRSGQQRQAQRALQELQRFYRRGQIDPAPMLHAYVGMGRKDKALAWLEKACVAHSPALTALGVDPIYDPLRSDPRFQDVLRRIGLAQDHGRATVDSSIVGSPQTSRQ